MLSHDDARCGADDGAGGGNVECAEAITAGADDVENLILFAPRIFNRRLDRFFAERAGKGGNFFGCFAFLGEAGEKFRLGRRGDGFVRERRDGVPHLFRRQGLRGGELNGESFEHDAILRWHAKGTN